MKTALIHCPYVSLLNIPPLAPALLKACLSREGLRAQTFDFNLDFQTKFDDSSRTKIMAWMTTPDITIDTVHFLRYQDFVKLSVDRVLAAQPTSIGVSVFSHESQRFAEDFCYWARVRDPTIYILIGGSGAMVRQNFYSKLWGEVMLDSGLADCVLIGEGESMIADIIKNFTRGLIKTAQIDNEQLADLPVPDFDDYDLDAYGPRHRLQLPITASKGCVRSCSFCDVAAIWPRFRYRRGENVATEMIEVYQRYGIKNFAFTDSLINGGLKPFREMNSILSQRLPKTVNYSGQFICRSQRDMPPKDFELMKLGGCDRVSIGMESGSEQVRAHMKKNFDNVDLDYTVGQLLQQGILQIWNIIVGYPTETDRDWQDTMDLIYRYRQHHDLIKIYPVGVFQLLQNTPITEPEMLHDLDIESHTLNGYSEYAWQSRLNPGNDLRARANRWKELVQIVKELDMLTPVRNLEQKTMVINQQVEYYEKFKNQQDRPVFPIYEDSVQDPTNLNYQ